MRSTVLICFFCQAVVLADNLGDHFYRQQAYFDAITEYKRILVLKRYRDREDILFSMAKTYYEWGKPREAEEVLLQIIGNAKTKDLETSALVLLAKIHWDSYNYEAMRAILDQLSLEFDDAGRRQFQYIRAWTYIYQARWEQGIKILKELHDPQLDQLAEELSHVYKVPQKSVQVARLLSSIIPGAGQLYSSDYENALYSFLLVGSIATSMIWDIYQKAYFTGIVKYLFLYTRYSKGSIYRMESKIVRSNVDRVGDFLKTVSDKYPEPIEILEGLTS